MRPLNACIWVNMPKMLIEDKECHNIFKFYCKKLAS